MTDKVIKEWSEELRGPPKKVRVKPTAQEIKRVLKTVKTYGDYGSLITPKGLAISLNIDLEIVRTIIKNKENYLKIFSREEIDNVRIKR